MTTRDDVPMDDEFAEVSNDDLIAAILGTPGLPGEVREVLERYAIVRDEMGRLLNELNRLRVLHGDDT